MTRIVAEMSCNHLGSLDRALAIVRAAANAGADAVKLQTWTPGSMVVDKGYVIPDGPWAGRNLAELYEEAHTPWEWYPEIHALALELDIECFSSVFDLQALEFLETHRYGHRHKVSSFELTDTRLLEALGKTGKPLILSTGMAEEVEIHLALKAAGTHRNPPTEVTLLKCSSAYPAPLRGCGLLAMQDMRRIFGVPVGFSDHTRGIVAAITAAALGATMIEKHLTLRRSDGGPDAEFSAEPEELAALVKGVREAREARAVMPIGPTPEEMPQRALRRSTWWAFNLHAGGVIERHHFRTARPGTGMPPHEAERLFGSKTARDVFADTPVRHEDFA